MKASEFRKLIREEVRKVIKEVEIPATWEDAIDQRKEVLYLQNRLDQNMKGFTKPFKAVINKQHNDAFIYINAKDRKALVDFLKKKGFKYITHRNSLGQGDEYFTKKTGEYDKTDHYNVRTKKIV